MNFSIQTSRSVLAAILVSASCAVGLALPAAAGASRNQIALFQDDSVFSDPAGTLSKLHSLGVGEIRVSVQWRNVAPNPQSSRRPAGFNATDPNSYPAASWRTIDTIVRDAHAQGIQVLMLVGGGAPRWATGSDQPAGGPYYQWKPSASEYEQFVQAIALRYNGAYFPGPRSSALPRVSSWEIWNEPNWGPSLAPQAPAGNSALMYRSLLDAGWTALQRTGHRYDTVVMGSLSPRGFNHPGAFSTTKPMQFVRSLYCVDTRYRELRGSSAAAVGCPTTASASRSFRAQHPALFSATAFGVHPYPFSQPPTKADSRDRDYVEFNEIPRFAAALDKLQHTYGSRKRLLIYNTEYGYETNPPNKSYRFVSPNTAAAYINWAEYLSWRNPRIATTMQYLLSDPNPTTGRAIFGYGSFAAGLIFYHGAPKADYYAYRMPLFLPVTSTKRKRSLEVWGGVRPASTVRGPQKVKIQYRRGSRGSFKTVKTVPIRSSRGYFDVRLSLPASGVVRTAWRAPTGSTIYSRTAAVKIH
ncbi:MAG: hypothetical protein ACR2JH_02210 [Solirubrobacteraceae bacterium]